MIDIYDYISNVYLKSLKKIFTRAERAFNGAEHGKHLRESSIKLMMRRMDENRKQIVHVTGALAFCWKLK
jgi:hypothetical protein